MTARQPPSSNLLLVAGSGRSGTSLAAGLAGRLGYHIPVPEVSADDSNPRGFGEPRWAVDFHNGLLSSLNASAEDGRPRQWELTAGVRDDEKARARLQEWLSEQLAVGSHVVVKDPRLSWFLDLYVDAGRALGTDLSVITMLRHPAESIRSRELAYGSRTSPTTRVAGWLNMMLGTELRTRGLPRAVIRYEDLLQDWRGALERAEAGSGIPLVSLADQDRLDHAGTLVDSGLRRATPDWAALDLPAPLQDLTSRCYDALGALADGQDDPALLDALRDEYAATYAAAEEISRSSQRAARVEERRKARRAAQADDTTSSGVRAQARRVLERVRRS